MGNKLGRSTESKFTKSTGLYPTCEWDDKAVKKLINKKKIAPRYPGSEDAGADLEECPICFLWYPGGLNRSKCCRQPICTECFLQFKKPSSQKAVQCPFCNAYNYSVKYYGTLSKEEREVMEQEEQKVIAAQIRIKKEEMERQEEREKEVQAERLKRLEEGPPPAAVQPSSGEHGTQGDPARRVLSSSQTPRHRPTLRPSENQDPQSDAADDVYLDRDDTFQVDVEELMVMEAIRLSLLESHTQGISQRDSRLDAPSAQDDYGLGEHDGDEDEDEESSDDAAYLDAIELGREENWPAERWRDEQEMPALQPSARAAGHYGFYEELSRIETAIAIEDESGGGVADLISYNQSWFSSLMMTRAEEEGPRITSSPSIHAASSPSALEPASTLSPVISAKSYSAHRNSLSHDSQDTDGPHNLQPAAASAVPSPVQSLRDHAVTPARHQRPRTAPGGPESGPSMPRVPRESTGRVPRTPQHDTAGKSGQEVRASMLDSQKGNAPANPPVSPLIFGISPSPAAVESLDKERGPLLGFAEPSDSVAGLSPMRDETYELHFAKPELDGPAARIDNFSRPDSNAQQTSTSDTGSRQGNRATTASISHAEEEVCSAGDLAGDGGRRGTGDLAAPGAMPHGDTRVRAGPQQSDAHSQSTSLRGEDGEFESALAEQRHERCSRQDTDSMVCAPSTPEGGGGSGGLARQALEHMAHGGSNSEDQTSQEHVTCRHDVPQVDDAERRNGGAVCALDAQTDGDKRAQHAHADGCNKAGCSPRQGVRPGCSETEDEALFFIGAENVAKSYFLQCIEHGTEQDANRTQNNCNLAVKKFRVEEAASVGDARLATPASLRAVVLVLDAHGVAASGAEVRALLGAEALRDVPVLVVAVGLGAEDGPAGPGDVAAQGGTGAATGACDQLKRRLQLDDAWVWPGAAGSCGPRVGLFVAAAACAAGEGAAGEGAGAGWQAAAAWLRARMADA